MDLKDLIIRPATTADMDRLLALEQAVVAAERPFNPSIKDTGAHYYDLPKLIADPDTQLLVAEMPGEKPEEIVATGYAQLRTSEPAFTHGRHAYLGFMCVAEGFRGLGINQAIMRELVAWGRHRGVEDFYLDVYLANEPAIRAYEKFGFKGSMMEMEMKLDPDWR